eukprot:GHUV01030575.1.p1 GENE.GHUV01030575.1~~GHUV01030575.1.p1  ORF type:complete len:475 (+),score=162.34 GHUV01030575.1:605-2029(+)
MHSACSHVTYFTRHIFRRLHGCVSAAAVGQVYERSAIQRHLLQAALTGNPPTDPISNAVLPSVDLVPVYPMRSRAAQYRESTALECVRLAVQPNCTAPVRYLRRAAELVVTADSSSSASGALTSSNSSSLTPASSLPLPASGAAATGAPNSNSSSSGPGFSIPGMTLDLARYLAAHQGSAYDALVLKYFGNELLRAGCADSAADVFYRLLLEAEDRVQQAEYLQLCLDCWTSSNSSSVDSAEAPAGAEPISAAGEQQPGAALSPAIIGKLADFVQRQRSLSPSAIVHMLQSTNHGTAMAMQLCQVLLARASAAAAAAAGPGSEAEAVVGLPGGLGGALEVLVSFVELGDSQLREQLQDLASQLRAAEAVHGQAGVHDRETAVDGSVVPSSAEASTASAAIGVAVGESKRIAARSRSQKQGAVWRGGKGFDVVLGRVARVAAAGTLTAAHLAGGNHLLLRAARVAPLMYLLRAGL